MGCGTHRLRRARDLLTAGGILAYPTESVYGLGCDPRNAAALARLLELKQRPPDKGLILIAADYAALRPYVHDLGPDRMASILATWPGPHTWLLPVRDGISPLLYGAHDSLAVRVTAHPLAAALCREFGGALVSTSANRAGRLPARLARQVRHRLGAWPDLVLAGECGPERRPSTIRDGRTGRLLRA